MIDALGIDGEDSIDVLVVIEQAFGITISDAKAAGCETIGDLLAIVCARVPMADRTDRLPCLIGLTFRALRRTIRVRQPDVDLRPDTELATFAGSRDHRAWHSRLEQTTGLVIPAPTLSARTLAVCLTMLAGIAIATLWRFGFGGTSLIAVVFEGALVVICAMRYASRTWNAGKTLGDLARETTAHNMVRSIAAYGAVRSRDVWAALVILVGPFARRSGEIGLQTRFFAQGRRVPARR